MFGVIIPDGRRKVEKSPEECHSQETSGFHSEWLRAAAAAEPGSKGNVDEGPREMSPRGANLKKCVSSSQICPGCLCEECFKMT